MVLTAPALATAIRADEETAARLRIVVVAVVEQHAPGAPEPVKDEAEIRLAGYLLDAPPAAPGSGHAAALRNCGAEALLSPWRVRRGGVIGGEAAPTAGAPVDRGLTVMRGAHSTTGVFVDSDFVYGGTANRMMVIPAVPLGSSFAFWLPGDLQNHVVAWVSLNPVTPSTVTLADFMLPVPYEFAGEAGLLRRTSTFFTEEVYELFGYRAALASG